MAAEGEPVEGAEHHSSQAQWDDGNVCPFSAAANQDAIVINKVIGVGGVRRVFKVRQ